MDNVSISSLRTGGKGNEEAVLRVRRTDVCPVACGCGTGPNESRTREARGSPSSSGEARRTRKSGGSRSSSGEARRTRKGGRTREEGRAREEGGTQESREGPTGHRDGRED